MLVAILGSHGVGKSTLLRELSLLDYNVDSLKVSREVQKEMGFKNLSEAIDTFDKMRVFQENIIERKYKHDLQLSQRSGKDVVFVERSFYDILAYCELWSQNFNSVNEGIIENWLSGYKQACISFQKEVYTGLVLVEPHQRIKFENDPERASEQTKNQIDLRLKELCLYSEVPVNYIVDHNIKNRINSVISFISRI